MQNLKSDLNIKNLALNNALKILEGLQDKLNSFDPADHVEEDLYKNLLDEIYQEVCEALPVSITGSELLEEHDPTAYRCGFNDYVNNFDLADIPSYVLLQEEIEEVEEEIEELKEEIEFLQQEIEEEEEQDQ